MHHQSALRIADSDSEYRTIETALLETARGRWFLAEYGRRARRLDTALLDDAIGRLKTSLRQPPALLGQLEAEIEELRAFLLQTRQALLAKAHSAGPEGGEPPAGGILRAAEDLHELAWSLQASEVNPEACESIARSASTIYALSVQQSVESQRAQAFGKAIDNALMRLDGIIETLTHEAVIDSDEPPADHELAALSALIEASPGTDRRRT